jgi:hypothetical protein
MFFVLLFVLANVISRTVNTWLTPTMVNITFDVVFYYALTLWSANF